ncbi:hypothetical protein P022_00596 [Enterococcus faecalis EnGen0422]|nr:hypothetical protein DR75_18 [Enterococcus faecalis ATCC 29212]EOJ74603.1 hypothetical protein WMY_00809 [Enterococcus faecalis EnGen0337]EOL85004.1 hypothetical protein UMW_00893 [Enterococcus faecalis EnGen0295]EOL88479.1 hypothetical protein UMY_00878 [Enterococcus faecalis EnGen0283]ETU38038.1 hypothetical protein P017_02410 [Enterococcus faecalis EnGen0417]ETU53840.1 hypothetical protein P022_00596 [Enterococcus faecalis EnGen0422]ETU61488.1 hypothetical protein P025_02207 [Enterococc
MNEKQKADKIWYINRNNNSNSHNRHDWSEEDE